jgi:hypothetical protein
VTFSRRLAGGRRRALPMSPIGMMVKVAIIPEPFAAFAGPAGGGWLAPSHK